LVAHEWKRRVIPTPGKGEQQGLFGRERTFSRFQYTEQWDIRWKPGETRGDDSHNKDIQKKKKKRSSEKKKRGKEYERKEISFWGRWQWKRAGGLNRGESSGGGWEQELNRENEGKKGLIYAKCVNPDEG